MARTTRRPGNLPAQTTTFVGRRRELSEVRTALGAARVVSLVGPGGVGKTRLALRVATELVRGFRDGAWLVELAQVRDPALVTQTAVSALGLRDQAAAGGPSALLRSFLEDKELLLVVDNCEHLRDAAARFITAVAEAAAQVRVIATTREPLSVPGEHVIPVPPLQLPLAEAAEPLQALRENESVALFTQRAKEATGTFELTRANQAAVVGVCRRLDGLPLALELAAVRTRLLTPEQILQYLDHRFDLLTGGGPAALPRQQTLRTTLDWSHDLLTARERILLRRLSVFAGRFTLDDAEAVCTGDGLTATQILDTMSWLVDKSLVVKEEAGTVAVFRLHETTHEYAHLKLVEAGEHDTLAQRYLDFYSTRCRAAAPGARYHLVDWLTWLDLEIDNLRAVLRDLLSRGDVQRAAQITVDMNWYWITRASTEGLHWLDEVTAGEEDVDRDDVDEDEPRDPAGAYFLRGFLAVLRAEPASAGPDLARAASAARAAGQLRLATEALSMRSVAASLGGDHETGRQLLEEARQVASNLDDVQARLALLQAEAIHGFSSGDLQTFRSASSEGARLSRHVGDLYTLQIWLMNQGFAALLAAEGDDAGPLLTEGLQIARSIDDRLAQSYLVAALGCHAAAAGDPHLAATLLGAADSLRAQTSAHVNAILAPLQAAATTKLKAELGDTAFARAHGAGLRAGSRAGIALALQEPDPRRTGGPPSQGRGPLAERESQVARLLSEGLTNKQIGARLFISERTVENHVRNIMNKLGFTSRAQIAGWVAAP